MGMNIKDPVVHAMARELAERRSTSVTDAVRQALRAELLVQFLQVVVLRSEAALARGVDHEDRLAGEVSERNLLAVVVDEGEVIEGFGRGHAPIVSPRGAPATWVSRFA